MGFFGLFKKPSPVAQTQVDKKEIKINQFGDWLEQSNSEKIKSILTDLSSIWKELLSQIYSLQSSISFLEKARFEPNDRMYAPINMIKDRFVTKSKLLSKIPKSTPEKFSEIKSTYIEASKLLSDFKEADVKQAHVISVYFKKEAEQIVKTLKSIDNLLSVFEKKLNSDGQLLQVVEEISGKVESVKKLKNDITALEKNKADLTDQIEKCKTDLEKKKIELNNISRDSGWSELEKAKQDLEKTDSEIQKIKHSMIEDLSSIKRPVKKILHESESKNELPEDIENLDSIYSTFNMIDSVLSKHKIDLKGTELEKLNQFRNKLASGELEKSRKEYTQLNLKKIELKNNYNKFGEIEILKKEAEHSVKETEVNLEKLRLELEKAEKEKVKSDQEVEKLKKEIEKTVLEKLNLEVIIN